MVPAMYFLCKLLFRKTPFAFLGTFLMTFDFMHLAQTRLGTIDSYPVLFIILEFYFMMRYAYHSFYHEKFWKTLPSLFLSGLFMGLGMASKWIGIYAAVGLAVLFFTIFGTRTKEYIAARRELAEEKTLSAERRAQCENITSKYPKRALWTILCCVLFFVVIPLGIYIGSYYQFLRIDAPHHGSRRSGTTSCTCSTTIRACLNPIRLNRPGGSGRWTSATSGIMFPIPCRRAGYRRSPHWATPRCGGRALAA